MKVQEVILRAMDGQRQRPSPKRVGVETVAAVLRLYREQYQGFNVAHFHERLVEEHGIALSCAWVKKALQTATLVRMGQKRVLHRKRRERRPLPGMLVFCDGSTHPSLRLCPGQRQDLSAYLDHTTSQAYAISTLTTTDPQHARQLHQKQGQSLQTLGWKPLRLAKAVPSSIESE